MWSFLAACVDPLDDDTPYVDEPRVLAVRAEPPEADPGASVTFTALYADASGALADAPLDWAFCVDPKPLAELGPVSTLCLDPDSTTLAAIGSGITVTGTVPEDVCSRFGPNPPPPEEGQPAGRPADPDVTGGYYQPLLAFPAEGFPTLASERIRCGIANVAQETYIAWNQGYLSNVAPQVAELLVDGVAAARDGDGEPATVAAGETVTLTASWQSCDAPCAGAETYLLYDDAADELVERREAVSATWFATAGTFADARNGRSGDDEATSVENEWTAPDGGQAWLAVVLRDERGGVDWAAYRVAAGE